MRLIFYVLLLLVISCSNLKKADNKQISVIGKWQVQEAQFKGTIDDMVPTDQMDLYTFFGSSIWSKAEGNTFVFNDDGTWSSSMIPEEIVDKVKLKYKFKENISVNAHMLLDSITYEFEILVSELESDVMIWKFGNYMDVILKRII